MNFKFADIGEGIHEGKLLEWYFKVGDKVKNGESIFLVETDKVNAEIPSPVSGTISKLLFEVGDIIKVGDIVVIIDEENKDVKNIKEEPKEKKGAGVVGEISVSDDVIPSFNNSITKTTSKKKVLATPVARKLAKDLGLDINSIEGSGENGRVMKDDINKFYDLLNKKTIETKSNNNIVEIENSEVEVIQGIRKAIYEEMTRSNQIPATTIFDDANLDELVKIKENINEEIKITFLPFIVKATCLALKEFPMFNSSLNGNEILYKKFYNIGIAVDTQNGLIVPVLNDADKKSLLDIRNEILSLANRAKEKSLTLDELKNSTFSITNYGFLGGKYATPIIKLPEVAILGTGKITKQPIVIDDEINISYILPLSLSLDHRVIDGADGARFLNKIKYYLENPKILLLS